MTNAEWWPPKVGDKLRHATLHGAGNGGVKRVEALLHVLAVFEHNGWTLVVTAEWFPSRRRWHYDVIDETKAEFGAVWPEGAPRPT